MPWRVHGENTVSETDLNIFLFVLGCPDLRKLQIPLTRIPAEADHTPPLSDLSPK